MKAKIKDLHPNPYRNIDTYKLDEAKVNSLGQSINQTGFWDNLLARSVDGKIQIAYGHHRLEALRRAKDPDFEVDIPVKNLDDATMIKIMANENMDNWSPTVAMTDETVRVARQFLIDHPEEIDKMGFRGSTEPPGKRIISSFLGSGWNETKVGSSLERIKLVQEEKVDQDVMDMFPTDGSARTYIETLKEEEKSGTPIPKEKQKAIVESFVASGNKKEVLKDVIKKEIHSEPKNEKQPEDLTIYFEDETLSIIQAIKWFEDSLFNLEFLYKKYKVPDQWGDKNWHQILMDNLNKILVQINSFLTSYKDRPLIRQ